MNTGRVFTARGAEIGRFSDFIGFIRKRRSLTLTQILTSFFLFP